MKATHRGTCQCCGNIQKLPGSLLSQHGYRVLWNQFTGVCSGAGHPPYEQSCDLIHDFIAAAQVHRDGLCNKQRKLRQPATEPKGWYYDYIERSAPRWREVELTTDDRGILCYTTLDGKHRRLDLYESWGNDLLRAATLLNSKYADFLQKDIDRVNQYIRWQQQRVAEWEPRELLPIKE